MVSSAALVRADGELHHEHGPGKEVVLPMHPALYVGKVERVAGAFPASAATVTGAASIG
jgi:hypothetical protein